MKFRLNRTYDHKAEMIADAFHIEQKRLDFLMDELLKYWNTLSEKSFMVSKVLDFIEQQDWTLIEKLYITERFASIHEDEMTFGEYNIDLLEHILKVWKDKCKIDNEESTRENLKHMFKLLMEYDLDDLVSTLKEIDTITKNYYEENEHEDNTDEPDLKPKDMEKIQENIQKPIVEKHIPNFTSTNNVSFYQ